MAAPRNLILSDLPEEEQNLIMTHLQPVYFRRQDVLFAAGQKQNKLCFPESCIVSLIVQLPEGRDVACATVGYEGVAGLGGALANQVSFTLQSVLIAGSAHLMERKGFLQCYRECRQFAERVHAFHDAFIAQSLQTTACFAVHDANERLARWILEFLDRSASPDLVMTHDTLGLIVGISRPTVTLRLRELEAAKTIKTERRRINILDRAGLEDVACSCYRLTREAYARAGLAPSAEPAG